MSEVTPTYFAYYTYHGRFLVDMPLGVVFLVFGILLRMTEGVGWAMSTTTTLSLIAQLFPDYVGTLSVSRATTELRTVSY